MKKFLTMVCTVLAVLLLAVSTAWARPIARPHPAPTIPIERRVVEFDLNTTKTVQWEATLAIHTLDRTTNRVIDYRPLIPKRTSKHIEVVLDPLFYGIDLATDYPDRPGWGSILGGWTIQVMVWIGGVPYRYSWHMISADASADGHDRIDVDLDARARHPLAVADSATTLQGKLVKTDVMANDFYDLNEVYTYPIVYEGDWWQSTGSYQKRHVEDGWVVRNDSTDVLTFYPHAGFVGTTRYYYDLSGNSHIGDVGSFAPVTVKVTPRAAGLSKVAFIGGSSTTASDTPFVNRLKAAGYTVTRYDDDGMNGADHSVLFANSIVVISSSVDVANYDKLATIVDHIIQPVVTWEPNIAQELELVKWGYNPDNSLLEGLEDPAPWASRHVQVAGELPFLTAQTIRPTVPTHPIMKGVGRQVPLTGGATTLLADKVIKPPANPSASMDWSVISDANLHEDAKVLARRGDFNAVVVNEEMRHVLLPWTFETAQRIDADGLKLFDQAVKWAGSPAVAAP